MSFLEELFRKVKGAAYSATEKAQEFAAVAGEKGKGVAETAKTNVALINEKRALEKNYRAIGEWYVSTLGEETPEAVADIVASVRASAAKIAEMEGALKKTQDEAEAAVAAAKDKAGDLVGKVREKAGEVAGKVKEKAEDLVEKVTDKAEDAAEPVEEAKEKAEEIVEEIKEKAEPVTEEIKETAEEIVEEIKKDEE